MNDKSDPNALHPALARQFIDGTLQRIKEAQPDFYPYVIAQIHAIDPAYQLNGLWDSVGDIGTSLSSAISSAATAYGSVLINRENAKTAAMVAQDQAKSQIDLMNAQLKAQQASTQNQFAQQQIALQQQQLLKTGAQLGGGSTPQMVWIIGGIAVLGIVVLAMRPRA